MCTVSASDVCSCCPDSKAPLDLSLTTRCTHIYKRRARTYTRTHTADKNNTTSRQHITLSPAFPAKVVPLRMDKHPQGFFLSKGAWMAGIGSNQEFGVAMVRPHPPEVGTPSFPCCMHRKS